MKCPHCLIAFHDEWMVMCLGHDEEDGWFALTCTCAACDRLIIQVARADSYVELGMQNERERFPVWPKVANREPLAPSIPTTYAKDYSEACLVLSVSPKASAALSRRCLQALLRDVVRVKPGSLDKEIQQVIDDGRFPSHIADSLDAVRTIGNFAAHPIKSQSSGEIIEVEPGEAEWTLDVLESLFDFLFVQPAVIRGKREALDAKLAEAGKPPLKSPAKAEEESDV